MGLPCFMCLQRMLNMVATRSTLYLAAIDLICVFAKEIARRTICGVHALCACNTLYIWLQQNLHMAVTDKSTHGGNWPYMCVCKGNSPPDCMRWSRSVCLQRTLHMAATKSTHGGNWLYMCVCQGNSPPDYFHPPSPSKFTPFCLEGLVQYMSLSADPRAPLCKRHV